MIVNVTDGQVDATFPKSFAPASPPVMQVSLLDGAENDELILLVTSGFYASQPRGLRLITPK